VSQSYDPSGRPLKKVEWSLTAGTSAALTIIMAAVNERINGGR
jgi:hypothetical protein